MNTYYQLYSALENIDVCGESYDCELDDIVDSVYDSYNGGVITDDEFDILMDYIDRLRTF